MTLKDQFVVRFILFKIPNRKGRNKFLMQATLTHDTYVLCVYIYLPVVTPRTHSFVNPLSFLCLCLSPLLPPL